MGGYRLLCPVCGSRLEDQTWAQRPWVDCPSMHRLAVDAGTWEEMCRRELLVEIRDYMAGLPPIPVDGSAPGQTHEDPATGS